MRQTTISELVGETHARTTDPTTSHSAAAQLSSKHTMMRVLLNVYASAPVGGLTSEEACTLAGYDDGDGAWKRVSDLKNQQLIVPLGRTRMSRSGRQQQVLVITEAGKAAL